MTKHLKADSMLEVLEEYFKAEARLSGVSSRTIVFKLHIKPKLRLEDSAGRLFDLDHNQLKQFTSKILTIESMKWVKIRNFEFDTKFDFKNGQTKCTEIVLLSTQFDFIGDLQTYNGKGPLVKSTLLPGTLKISDFPQKVRGYINRIGKRKFVGQAEFGINEINSLVEYIPKKAQPLSQLSEITRKRAEEMESIKINKINYLNQLNSQGQKQLRKMVSSLKRRDIFDHLVRKEFRDPSVLQQIGAVLIKPQYMKNQDASEGMSDQ